MLAGWQAAGNDDDDDAVFRPRGASSASRGEPVCVWWCLPRMIFFYLLRCLHLLAVASLLLTTTTTTNTRLNLFNHGDWGPPLSGLIGFTASEQSLDRRLATTQRTDDHTSRTLNFFSHKELISSFHSTSELNFGRILNWCKFFPHIKNAYINRIYFVSL